MSSISLGTTAIPWRNEKQRLCKILGGKHGALWEMCKWRMTIYPILLRLRTQALQLRKTLPCSSEVLNFHEFLTNSSSAARGTLHNGLYGGGGGLRPKGISLVEIYERVGKSVVSVVKRPKWLTDAFYGCENVGTTFCFCHFFLFLRQQFKGCKVLNVNTVLTSRCFAARVNHASISSKHEFEKGF